MKSTKFTIDLSDSIASLVFCRIVFLICGITACMVLSACTNSNTSKLTMSTAGELVVETPDFLQARAINANNLDAIVTVEDRQTGELYSAVKTSANSFPWKGELYVPENLSPIITVSWIETQVSGLPPENYGVLPLATYVVNLNRITTNWSVDIQPHQYITHPSQDSRFPELDLDNDGSSNLEERQAGSRPADATDVAQKATILYTPVAPVIDGVEDDIWEAAQKYDRNGNLLKIDTRLWLKRGDRFASESEDYKWAGMHDGEYLYLLIHAEKGANQTPVADRFLFVDEEVYQPRTNDSIDILLDGNHSKVEEDGFDDYRFVVALMLTDGRANSSSIPDRKEEQIYSNLPLTIDNERPVTAAIEYANCICNGTQQLYEVKLELAGLNIPLDSSFGFDVQINNDWDEGFTETSWAWSARYPSIENSMVVHRPIGDYREALRLEPIPGSAVATADESPF